MNFTQEKSKTRNKLNSLWRAISEPGKSITDPIQRFKAQLVIYTIIILTALITISIVIRSNLSPFVLIGLLTSYILSRTKYNAVAAFLVIINISSFVILALFRFSLDELTTLVIFTSTAWFTPSLILSGLIFKIRDMILISFFHILFPFSLLFFYPGLPFSNLVISIGYLVIVSFLIVVTMRLRNLLEFERLKEIQGKTKELNILVKERTAEIEAFSYSVSHDLRAPLRHIIGFGQILQESTIDKLDVEEKENLERILSSAKRMNSLIDDLLKLSRISQQSLVKEEINLSILVSGICEDLKQSSPDRVVDFKISDGIIAQADRNLMHIALENLLSNAWKFTTHKPHAVIEFGVKPHKNQRVYFIKDNGMGFDQKYANKAFEPFQRLHSADEIEGSGIGLAIVKWIIKRHSGTIWAESEVGKGAALFFTLP